MKKYLMTGIAALAMGGIFTSCSHDMNQYTGNQSEQVLEKYEQVFVNAYGEPADNQTWGFGSATVAGTRGMTRSNPGVDYPSTSTGINANANEWADPAKEYGGWVVPDPLTDEQKEVVKAYFQANPNLTFQDPEWRHFFVQQVYKGKTDPGTNSTEEVTAADNTKYTSDNMNLLTVGYNEQHINNFNSGNCSVNGNVLDNGGNVNSGPYHSDQIMLMVNIDDTQCFGYHNTGMSLQRNDKAALVGWETIRTWANSNGLNGDCLDDKWNRSFMGFDFELFTLEESYAKSNGNIIYAPINDVPGNAPQYIWDGTQVLKRGESTVNARRGGTRSEGTSVNIWSGNEEKSNSNAMNVSFSDDAKNLLVAGNYLGVDLSVVTEWYNNEWSYGTYNDWKVEFMGGHYNSIGNGVYTLNANSTNLEIKLSADDVSSLTNQGYQVLVRSDANPIIIKRVYISEYSQANGNGGDDNSGDDNTGDNTQNQEENNAEDTYIIIDGEMIPYLNANMNMYGGTQKSLSDGDMKITKDGKECLNLPAFKALVDDGYLPVKDKNLRTWVKWAGGDGYFSDWIVTLSRAKRIDEGEGGGDDDFTTEEIRVIAEDLNAKENSDFDFNDVVFDVLWSYNDDKSTQKVKVKLLACGAEYSIYIGSDDNNFEIHEAFAEANKGRGITLRRYDINTVDGHDKYTYPVITLADDCWSGTTIKDIAKSILVRVSKSGILYELEAPKGKAPGKIAVGTDFDWCDEHIDIDDKYYFKDYVGDPEAASKWDTWYKLLK